MGTLKKLKKATKHVTKRTRKGTLRLQKLRKSKTSSL